MELSLCNTDKIITVPFFKMKVNNNFDDAMACSEILVRNLVQTS